MKIAILSDSHDHLDKTKSALKILNTEKCEAIIFCGDMISPFTTGVVASANLPTYAVLGNNDEDHIGMMKKGGDKFVWFHLSQEYGEIEIDGKKIAFCHYKRLAELLAKTDNYSAVFYGHTHVAHMENVGDTLLLNPGAICGINFQKGAYDKASFAIYNTKTNSADIVEIK